MIRPRWWMALACTRAAGDAAAQTGDGGTWFGVGAGGGWPRVSCSICSAARDLGPAGNLRTGTALGPGLLVGVEAGAWTHAGEGDERESVGTVAGVGYLYPRAAGPLYLKGDAGYVAFRAGDDLAPTSSASSSAPAGNSPSATARRSPTTSASPPHPSVH